MGKEVEPVETEFGDEEIEAMLGIAGSMTKGQYLVPDVKPGHAPHLIKVTINEGNPAPHKHEGRTVFGWMCLAAVLQWGKDVLDEHMRIEDFSLKTKTKQRKSNAAMIAWVGNNQERLLYEFLEMRKRLQELELLVPRQQ